MERITYHGENIQGYEQALQKMDPDAYNKYAAEFRQATNDGDVIPFNKDEGIMSVREKDYDDALFDQKAKNEIQKNVNKETEELNKINEIEELSQDLSKESDVDKILSKSEELKKSKAGENLNIPEWAQKSLDRLNELKKYYSKNPPNNKDTLNLYNKQVVQREKALRYTLESGGDEAMFEKLRIGPKTKIPEVFETNNYVDLLPTNQEKTMRNVYKQG